MDGVQVMKDLLLTLGGRLGVSPLVPDEEGYVCILIDEVLLVHLVYDREAEALRIFSELCALPASDEKVVMRALLDANVLWRGSQGATLGVDLAKKVVTLAYREPLGLLTPARLEQILEGFVMAGEYWIKRIGDIARDSSAPRLAAGVPLAGLRV